MHVGNSEGSRAGRACWAASQIGESIHTPGQRVSAKDPPADDGRSFCNHRAMSTPSPVRLVLFDVDGTLVDHDGAAAAAVQQWLMAMGWADAGTIAGLVSEWDAIAERHFPAYRARLTTFQGQRRLRLREFLPLVGIDASTWSDDRLDDLFRTYLVAYEATWRSFPDAEPCLQALRGVAQIAVLSNGNQEQQEAKVSRTGLARYIDVVMTSDQLGVAKPDPRAFELACGRLGVPARAAVYVGDQREVDAIAATAAGCVASGSTARATQSRRGSRSSKT
jgi:putative hydrolase of the HAD superfamily